MLVSVSEAREAALVAALAAVILRTCVQDVVESSSPPLSKQSAETE